METIRNDRNNTVDIRRSGSRVLTRRRYNLLICGTVAWGFAVNVLICMLFGDAFRSIGILIPGVIYVAVNIITILVISVTENAAVGFGGFTFLSASMGMLLCPVIAEFSEASIVWAMIQTGAICAVTGLLSTIFPNFFAGLGRGLFISLFVVIAVEFAAMLITGQLPDIVVNALILIFAGFFGYDLVKAQRLEPTAGNAIYCAVDIYLDIFNLFLELLASGDD